MNKTKLHQELVRLPFNLREEPEVVKVLTEEDFGGYNRNYIEGCQLIRFADGNNCWVNEMFLLDPNQL